MFAGFTKKSVSLLVEATNLANGKLSTGILFHAYNP